MTDSTILLLQGALATSDLVDISMLANIRLLIYSLLIDIGEMHIHFGPNIWALKQQFYEPDHGGVWTWINATLRSTRVMEFMSRMDMIDGSQNGSVKTNRDDYNCQM